MAIVLSSALAYAQYTPFRTLSVPVYWAVLFEAVLFQTPEGLGDQCLRSDFIVMISRWHIISVYRKLRKRPVVRPAFTDRDDVEEHFRTLKSLWR